MTTAEMFSTFIGNLKIDNEPQISDRYAEITRVLNNNYRDSDSETANSLQVGSYGRHTAIRGISDLDMIYMLPDSAWDRFKDGRQSVLLQEVKNIIKKRYPRTDMSGDGQVVVVAFDNQNFEVLPAFEEGDKTFTFADTNDGGSWHTTDPRSEISEISAMNSTKNGNLRPLCKMARAWKNKNGVTMGGLLIDTLAYNFLESTMVYDTVSYSNYDCMARDFFKYLSNEPEQEYYLAPGSNQRVYVKKKFQAKAKKAYKRTLEAIEAEGKVGATTKWKKIFGRLFPAAPRVVDSAKAWKDTEEFIEDKYPVNILYDLNIDCDVKQNGFLQHTLSEMLLKHLPLLPSDP